MPTKTTQAATPAANDNLAPAMESIVPAQYKGTDTYLDIVNWNIRYFNPRDNKRVNKIANIMQAINADIFTLLEIEEGSLEKIIEILGNEKAGYYKVEYGTTGGDQRIAIMYDTEWIRAKDDVAEIFAKKQYLDETGKDAFPRLPLRGYFTGLTSGNTKPFDFQLLGLHLKSQRGDGSSQREVSAQALASWISDDAPTVDSDIIMLGDWNEPPTAYTWKPLQQLEKKGQVAFTKVNDSSDYSHLMYQTKTKFGSRLDLTCVSLSSMKNMVDKKNNVIRWKPLDDLLANNPNATDLKNYIKETSEGISDHLPVVSRFYWKDK